MGVDAPRSVWALIRMIDEPDARIEGLSPSRWSQLKRLLRESDPQHLAAMARNRAQRRMYWIHPSFEERLLGDPRVHPSGWSALADLEVGLAAGDDVPIEVYCWDDDLEDVIQAHHLAADAVPNRCRAQCPCRRPEERRALGASSTATVCA